MRLIGIDAISFYVPKIYLSIKELSKNRDLEYEKLSKGLGLEKMSIPDSNEDPSSFAANALIDLFIKNKINPNEIGRIYMGTESALDSSKPSSTYATDLVEQYLEKDFGKRSLKNCDITDMTFACIGGVDALQNSLDWISSNTGKKAIVVCSDLSKYSLNSTGEYTQGAGAVALLLSENPSILSIENQWGVATKSENDFFKPRRTFEKKKLINEIIKNLDLDLSESEFEKKFSESPFWSDQNERIEVHKEEPVFDGQYSNECYIDRMDEAFKHFSSFKKIDFLNQWNHLIFHLPYAFHGRRMIFNNWLSWIRKDEKMKDLIEEIGEDSSEDWVKKAYKSDLYKDFIRKKIMPGELASSEIGNMYTASIFMSLLSMLSHQLQNSNNIIGNKVGFISYGSGSKSKIFNGTIMNGWKEKIEPVNLFDHLSNRKEISFQIYEDLHSNKNIDPITNHSIRFSHLQDSPNSEGYRKYKL
jgi:hydroxymethylglutaryl-CoA synthase